VLKREEEVEMRDTGTDSEDDSDLNMSSTNNYSSEDGGEGDGRDIDIPQRPQRCEELGELLGLAFQNRVEYDDDEERDIFDDGLTDEDHESDTDISTNYEELTEPDVIQRVVYVPQSPTTTTTTTDDDCETESGSNYSSSLYDSTPEADDDHIDLAADGEPSASEAREDKDIGAVASTAMEKALEKSFLELLQDPNVHKLSQFEKDLELEKWRFLGLEEMKRNIDEELTAALERQQSLEENIMTTESDLDAAREASGISKDLWEAYEAFCESMEPQFGSREGWSITCFSDHKGFT
jgi:hypothetical protein